MSEYLQTPIFASWLGFAAILFVIGLNGVLAFLAFLAYYLRAREWPVVAACFALCVAFNLWIPPPTIRRFYDGEAFPPADTIRLAFLLIGLATGIHALYSWVASHRDKESDHNE